MPTNAELYDRAIRIFDEMRAGHSADILTCESTETVFNRPARLRDLRRVARDLPLEQLLARVAALSIDLSRGRRPVDAVLQYRTAASLAPPTRRGRALLRRIEENPTIVLVQEEQLAVLAKFALVYSTSGDSWPSNGNELLLEALLAFNSLSAQEIHAGGGTNVEWLLRQEVRLSAADTENVASVLRRYGEFSKWASSEAARSARNYFDLAELFQSATSLSYLEFAAATLAFYVHFGAANLEAPADFRPFLDLDSFCSQLTDDTVLRTWVRQTTIGASEARQRLKGLANAMSIATLYPVMGTPLVEIRNGALACPALRYLPNVAGNGLIFRLAKFLETRDGAQEAMAFRGFFGTFLEWYVLDILKKAARELDDVRFFSEIVYGRDSKRSSDIAVFRGSTAVFVDVTSKRFNTVGSVIELNSESIDRDLRAMVTSKYTQIDNRARDFRSGELRYPEVDSSAVTDIIGLVVTPQGVTRFFSINNRVEALKEETRHLSGVDFFDLNEIEILEDAYNGRLDLHALVKAKLADPRGRTRTLVNYLHLADRERLRHKKSKEQVHADPWLLEVIETAKEWGLPGDLPDRLAGEAQM